MVNMSCPECGEKIKEEKYGDLQVSPSFTKMGKFFNCSPCKVELEIKITKRK